MEDWMPQKIVQSSYNELLNKVSKIMEEARQKTVRQINTVMVETYWHVGRLILEEEQRGKQRAEYGEELIKKLSQDLIKKFGKGFTTANLWNMRQFYSIYPKLYALRREFRDNKLYALRKQLSWTHFRILMRLDDPLIRQFYEIETVKNSWSSRELERQINSLLFERLALSKDKKKVLELTQKGQIIEKPEDVVKNPYFLEFLGIPEKTSYKTIYRFLCLIILQYFQEKNGRMG